MLSWLQNHMLPCALKSIFGIDCPICGFQRSFLLLLNGEFSKSFKMYPPLLFALLLILLAFIHLILPKYCKVSLLRKYSALVLIIISINYTAKLAIIFTS